MKKQRKLNLRKLSIAKLDKVLSIKGGTDDTDDTSWTGPKTRTKITKVPDICNLLSDLVGGC